MRQLFVLHNEKMRQRAIQAILIAKPESRVIVNGPSRTLGQNNLMWARLTEIARRVQWHGQWLEPDDYKDMFTAALRKARIVPSLDGNGFVQLGLHTSHFDTEEMGNMLDLIDAFAAEHGVEFQEGADP